LSEKTTLLDTSVSEPESDSKKKGRGQFFTVQPSTWARACDLGMYEAVAYLVLAQGTGRSGKTTSWSADSLQRYAGIRPQRGKAAIERLIEHGLLRHGEKHQPKKPRYDFTSAGEVSAERYRVNLAALSKEDRSVLDQLGGKLTFTKYVKASIERLIAAGLVKREAGYQCFSTLPPPAEESSNLIWLPNTLVTGAAGEDSPVKQIRQYGDVWALRTLVDLYGAQSLRDDGGIKPYLLWQEYERKLVGEWGIYNIWAFKQKSQTLRFFEELAPHMDRRKPSEGNHPFWASHKALQQTGLLTYVPHLWDNDPSTGIDVQAEILHPYGLTGAEDIERKIASAAHGAAMRVIIPGKVEAAFNEGFSLLCPVRSSIPNVCMVGVARLRYRPHTTRTGAWIENLNESGAEHLAEFTQLFAAVR
jgi:hypothetical protein